MGHFIFSLMHIFILITAFLGFFIGGNSSFTFSILGLLFFTISAHAIYSPIQGIYEHLTENKQKAESKQINSPKSIELKSKHEEMLKSTSEEMKSLTLVLIIFVLIGIMIILFWGNEFSIY